MATRNRLKPIAKHRPGDTLKRAQAYGDTAIKALDAFEDSPTKTALSTWSISVSIGLIKSAILTYTILYRDELDSLMRDTILFDINETVLDLSSLKPTFEALFGTAQALTWFATLLHSSTVSALTGVRPILRI